MPQIRKSARRLRSMLTRLLGEQLEDRRLLCNNVSGSIDADQTWSDTQGYCIVGDLTVQPGVTLTIAPGISVNSVAGLAELFVDGALVANDVDFTGAQTEIVVRSGGSLTLDNGTAVAGDEVRIEQGGSAFINNSIFSTAQLKAFTSQPLTVSGNTFQNSTPIETNPSLVPKFYGSNQYTVAATIDVQGTLLDDVEWSSFPNLNRYNVIQDVIVPATLTFDIQPGLVVNSSNGLAELFVDGAMTVSDVDFTGTQTELVVRNSGSLAISNGSTFAGDQVRYEVGSFGTINDATFSTAMLRVFSSGVSTISSNTFLTAAPVETNPSIVPKFYGSNTYAVNATIDVQGTMFDSAEWSVFPNLTRYNLTADVVVPASLQLFLQPGLTVNNSNGLVELFVDGTMSVLDADFTGTQTELVARSGGRLNLSNSSTFAGDEVRYESGSFGSIANSTFSTAKLRVLSFGVSSILGNTFQSVAPIETNPSLVPLLYGTNVYTVNATLDVVGTMASSSIWVNHPNLTRYNLTQDVLIPAGLTLTILPGLIVNNDNGLAELFVDGTLSVVGSAFTGTQTELVARSGGTMNLNGASLAGNQVRYEAGSFGVLVGSTFSTAKLLAFSSGLSVNMNTFLSATPVEANPSAVPQFYGTNQFAVNATMDVVGTMYLPVTWRPFPNLMTYNLIQDVVVPAGMRLDIQPGLTVRNTAGLAEMIVNGTVVASAVQFTGTATEIVVQNGGNLELYSSSINDGNQIVFQAGSQGALACTTIGLELNMNNQSAVRAYDNDLTFGTVRSAGSGTATVNLRNQYWGTTSAAAIEGKITHKVDNNNLPTVLFSPFLNAPSSACAAAPTVGLSIATSTQWASNFIDAVDGAGVGAGNGTGMPITAGGPVVPYDDVDRLQIRFSKPVFNIDASMFELRNSNGIVPTTLLGYDRSRFIATIAVSQPLAFGKYRLAVSDALQDALGNSLDGDASGQAGGIYDLRFDVLPGDANGDRRVNGADLTLFATSFNSQIGQANYQVTLDWNADGRVNGSDLTIFSANFNRQISSLQEPGAAFSGGGGGQGGFGSYFDDFFAKFGDDEEDDDSDALRLL